MYISFERDLERIESPVYTVKAHDQIVNAVDGIGGLGIGGGAPELVSGSRDGEKYNWPHHNYMLEWWYAWVEIM